MALTRGQVAGVASQGVPGGTSVEEWVAKARQESSFRPEADNGTAAGLWGINYRVHTQYDRARLKSDPAYNWTAAKAIFASQGWQAWAASGGRPTPTASDRAAVEEWDPKYAQPGSYDPGYALDPSAVTDVLNPLDEVQEGITGLTNVIGNAIEWITDPDTWRRIALVIAGVGIAFVAVNAIVRGSDFYQDVESQATGIAKKVATKGAA